MFFKTENFDINIISTHQLCWGKRNDNSDIRPYHALSFRISGNAKFIHSNTVTEVKSNDIVFVPAYCNYKLESKEEQLFVIHFETNETLPTTIKKFTPENSLYYRHKFEELHTAWSKKQTGYIHECKSIFFKILMHIERDYLHTEHSTTDERLSVAVDFIHDHFTDSNFTIDDLAQLCNMSGTYFRKLFQSKYHVSPLTYIKNLRLQYALELLKSGYYTISEISDKCGFKNIYYFSSFIKKETGFSPSEVKYI